MIEKKRPDERVVSIRLLPEEAEILKEKATEAHMSQAQFLKNVITYGGAHQKTIFTRDSTHSLNYEINRIGNNLNQIVFCSYGSEEIDKIELLKLRDNYFELLSAFYNFINGKNEK